MLPRLLAFVVVASHATLVCAQMDATPSGIVQLSPQNLAPDVNPDVRLKVTFSSAPPLGIAGKIRVYDASNDSVVDELDLGIPPGPKNTRTPPPYDVLIYPSAPDVVLKGNETDQSGTVYQENYIGGTTDADAYHFYPVFINDNEATICLHSHRLQYGKTYYVEIDADAFPFDDRSFAGITGKTAWTFSTKAAPPAATVERLVVAADGTGDFNSVQGAIDFIPDNNTSHRTIFVRNGIYEEIIYFRNKASFTLVGEDREKVVIRYSNNQPFNPSSGHYKRGVFAADKVSSVNLVNFTILNVGEDMNAEPIETAAQAEALYVRGDKLQVHNVGVLGSGDALQIQVGTRIYLAQSSVRGYGDNLLSYGAAFFKSCELISTYGPHGWPRNSSSSHGDVFLNSTFRLEGKGTSGDGRCDLARAPSTTYPDAEFVLIDCAMDGITSDGWNSNKAAAGGLNVRYWEYNSVNLSDGKPVDVSKRASYSRQLSKDNDAETIANYSNPTYVLDGWTPELIPLVLSALPETTAADPGESIELKVSVAALPEPTYQWFKDGSELTGETGASLSLMSVDSASGGEYSVVATNALGQSTSKTLVVVGIAGTQMAGAANPMVGSAAAGAVAGTSDAGALVAGVGASVAGAKAGVAGVGASAPASTSLPSGSVTTPERDAVAPSAGSSPTSSVTGATPSSSSSGGGCSVGSKGEVKGAWPLVLAGVLMFGRTRRRRDRR